MTSLRTKTTTNHEEIRTWTNAHGGTPTVVRGAEDAPAQSIRIVFPDDPAEQDIDEIAWDMFFRIFENLRLALRYYPNAPVGPFEHTYTLMMR